MLRKGLQTYCRVQFCFNYKLFYTWTHVFVKHALIHGSTHGGFSDELARCWETSPNHDTY